MTCVYSTNFFLRLKLFYLKLILSLFETRFKRKDFKQQSATYIYFNYDVSTFTVFFQNEIVLKQLRGEEELHKHYRRA